MEDIFTREVVFTGSKYLSPGQKYFSPDGKYPHPAGATDVILGVEKIAYYSR
jgi:hypothetical protein